MSEADLSIFSMVALIAINQLLIRSHYWKKHLWIFWSTQLLNSLFGSWALLIGLPGLSDTLDIINWIIGLLFFYHIARNQLLLQRFLHQRKSEQREEIAKEGQE